MEGIKSLTSRAGGGTGLERFSSRCRQGRLRGIKAERLYKQVNCNYFICINNEFGTCQEWL